MKQAQKFLLTAGIILIAVVLALFKYWDYVANPWTRDGQVRADVIQLTPRVSGPIVSLPIKDNQLVKAGDLLFKIDPRTFEAALAQARAQYDQTGDNYLALEKQVEAAQAAVSQAQEAVAQAQSAIKEVDSVIEKNRAEYQRQQEMLPQKATSRKAVEGAKANYEVALERRKGTEAAARQAEAAERQAEAALNQAHAALAKAKASLGAQGDANPQIRAARAAVRQAELNLEFTQVQAPVAGYVTNLNLRVGSHAGANQPALALVDVNSFWVAGFFRETFTEHIRPGDKATVTLMAFPDKPLKGTVDSLGWGISQKDGSTGFELLPNVSPTFDWIRLAQRIPVRIHLDEIPEGVSLRVGTTASVLVKTRTAEAGK